MDKVVDNCGLLSRNKWITTTNQNSSLLNLWITVDRVWTKKRDLIRENLELSLIHRPITTINIFYSYKYIGGTK